MSNTSTFDAMLAIAQSNGGQLTPAVVVDASRPEDAYFHDRFEWDDAKAAQRDREATAARLMRQIHVTRITDTERGPVRIRAFLPISGVEIVGDDDDAVQSWTYVSIDDLSANAAQAILRQMEKDVAGLRRKYRDHRAALDQMLRAALEEEKSA